MKLTDYILISRNGNLFKAPITALSSVVCFKSTRDTISSFAEETDLYIDNIVNTYPDTHYSKTEMKSGFSTKESVNSLTANQAYALTSTATNVLKSLSSEEEIDTWRDGQIHECAKLFREEMEAMKKVMKAAVKNENEYPSEYAIPPKVSQLESGTKNG